MGKRRFVNIYKDNVGRYISDRDYDTEVEARKFTDMVDEVTYIETVEIISLKDAANG